VTNHIRIRARVPRERGALSSQQNPWKTQRQGNYENTERLLSAATLHNSLLHYNNIKNTWPRFSTQDTSVTFSLSVLRLTSRQSRAFRLPRAARFRTRRACDYVGAIED